METDNTANTPTIASPATETAADRQPYAIASQASAGKNTIWPLALLAVRIPVTRPRRVENQRFATTAASGTPTAPVAPPTSTPQSRSSCQGAVMIVVRDAPVAIVVSAISITRRTP